MKSVKSILVLMLALVMVLGLCACGGNETVDPTNAPETTTNAANNQQPTLDVNGGFEERPEVYVYKATVQDADGNPIPGVAVSFCSEESGCSPAYTQEDGVAKCQTTAVKEYASIVAVEGYEFAEGTSEKMYYEEGVLEVTFVLVVVEG